MDRLLSTQLGHSEMAGLMRSFDWSRTDLGAAAAWPENLRGALSLCLHSSFPILLWWGARLTLLYNDACIPFLGAAEHPRSLGRPGRECWPELWDEVGPMLDSVMRPGQARPSTRDKLLFSRREVESEEVYVRFSFVPIMAPDGVSVQGVFCPCIETTQHVIGARRLETLRMLGMQASARRDAEAACVAAVRVLTDSARDIPFSAIYLVDAEGTQAWLAATGGLADRVPLLPAQLSASDESASPWHLASVLRSHRPARSANLLEAGLRLPGGPWPEPAPHAMVLPVGESAAKRPAALVVLGVSPRRPLDPDYDSFLALVAGQIGTAIAGARASEAERQRAGETLRVSEERFRRYFDLGLIGMALTSPAKGCLDVNAELCRILGYSREELLAGRWSDITHPDDVAADTAQFERVLAGEIDGYVIDKRWLRKDGRVVHTTMAAQCLRRPDGSVDCFVGLVMDITGRLLAADALRHARDELAHMARVTAMGELAASIAHEMNQPLTAIVASGHATARWLSADTPNMAEAMTAVERMVQDAHRASEVIGRIRGFVRRGESERASLDIAQVVRDVVAMVAGEASSRGVALSSELPPGGAAHVIGDRVQLEQVVLNLVMNGIEAMADVPPALRKLRIRVATEGVRALRVSVRDAGRGLDATERARVFEAFYTTKASGMGMGLAISRSIVEAHRGRLLCEANENGGETFSFTLPTVAAPG